jgi:L-threonylcarbamoyladenylate synthase
VAFDEGAVAKVFAAKERPSFDPLIVHIPSGWGFFDKLDALGMTQSSVLSAEARTIAEKLMRAFWPGPLTLVLPRGPKIPDLVTSGLSTVGVRMPRHALAQDLLRNLQLPLAAPSANRFGRISPTTSSAVIAELGDRVHYVLEGGPCTVGLESTIIHVAPDASLTLLRPGAISRQDVAALTGKDVLLPQKGAPQKSTAELAPGMLASHYAPRKKLTLCSWAEFQAQQAKTPEGWGLLLFANPNPSELAAIQSGGAKVELLSATNDWSESAQRLFAVLRQMDENPSVKRIFAENPLHTALPGKESGLALAILDRLTRAAAPRE